MKPNLFSLSALKSAVFFSLIFFSLSACDPKPKAPAQGSEQSANPAVAEQSTPAKNSPSRQLLRRALYAPILLQPEQLQQREQSAPVRDVLEGLVIYDPQGNVQAGVAETWQSADFKTWIFKLRPEARWSNGEQVTAHDFVRSWQKLALSTSPLKDYLLFMNLRNSKEVLAQTLPVEQLGVRALDDQSLKIELDKATPYLPEMLAHVALLPQYSGNGAEFIGNGAYLVKSQQPELLLLSKNPNYWALNKVAFEQVEYRQIAPQTPLPAQTDWLENPAQQQPVQQQEEIHYLPQLCTYFYEFNWQDPWLKQAPVRKALASMISPQNLLKNTQLAWSANPHFLPQNMQAEEDSSWNPTLVEQLLQQAGVSETKPLKLRISYDEQGEHPKLAQYLMQAWAQSDLIRVEADPVSPQQLQEKRAKGDFQLIRSGWCADYNEPSAFLNLAYSHSPDNKSGVQNANIDKLLAQSLAVKSAEQRHNLYQQIVRQLQQDQSYLSLFQYRKAVYISPSLAGYDEKNPTEVFYSKDFYRRVEVEKK